MICPSLLLLFSVIDSVLLVAIKERIPNSSIEQLSLCHLIVLTILMYLSETFTLLLYHIQKRNTLEKKKTGINFLPKSNFEKLKILLIIIVIIIVDCSSTFSVIYLFGRESVHFYEMLLKGIVLILATLLSVLILHYKYYKHHWLGCIIIIIGFIIFTFNDCNTNSESINLVDNSFFSIVLTIFLSYIWVAFQEVLEKYLMEIKYISPFVVIGLEGVGGLIVMTVGLSIGFLFFDDFSVLKFKEYISMIYSNGWSLIAIFGFLFVGIFGFNTFKVLTNNYYYPTYKGLSDVFGNFLQWILFIMLGYSKDKNEKSYYVIKSVSYVIMMIGIIIYLEIIQLNFCGFNMNTRKEIIKRTNDELPFDSYLYEEEKESELIQKESFPD